MKKCKFLYYINWLLVFAIPVILATTNVKTEEIAASTDIKKLKTNLFLKTLDVSKKIDEKENSEDDIEKSSTQDEDIDKGEKKEKISVVEIKEEVKETVQTDIKQEPEVTPVQKTDVLETFSGKLSYYTANCNGCSGYASGYYVGDGRLYYHDNTYGDVRIIAAGPEIARYSIVRIKNSSLGSNVIAIVLDRGGDIGQGRKFLIDMLTNDSESKGGVEQNIVVELLRKGR